MQISRFALYTDNARDYIDIGFYFPILGPEASMYMCS